MWEVSVFQTVRLPEGKEPQVSGSCGGWCDTQIGAGRGRCALGCSDCALSPGSHSLRSSDEAFLHLRSTVRLESAANAPSGPRTQCGWVGLNHRQAPQHRGHDHKGSPLPMVHVACGGDSPAPCPLHAPIQGEGSARKALCTLCRSCDCICQR